jgi:Tol biopolymer transport system component
LGCVCGEIVAANTTQKNQASEEPMQLWHGFTKTRAPGSGRRAIQLTSGPGTCYPLYYFIPSFTQDGARLIYHRAEAGEVQLHVLDLQTGSSRQLTHASAPETRWIPWCVESGPGVLDHRSVLDVQGSRGDLL